MNGMDRNTGKPLSGLAHLRQSVEDILSTPIGTRVMRREYGSQLFSLIDAPLNRSTVMDLYASTAGALKIWEPRIRVDSVSASMPEPGRVVEDITGTYLPDGKKVVLEGVEIK